LSSPTEGGGYAVKKDTVVSIQQPTTVKDALTEVLREGAQKLLAEAVQAKAKQALHQIWMAETREDAHRAFDEFIATYELKHPKAAACLAKGREELLAFYDFPAEHWVHLRTTNPIESTFATVRLRTPRPAAVCPGKPC
jgi:transposase-like protein